jgi:MFS family permease
MLVSFVCEFPSGVLADSLGKKQMFCTGIGVTAVAYWVIYSCVSFPLMCLAWVLYGIGDAARSSTMDLYFIAHLRSQPERLKRFYSINKAISPIASITAAALGYVLFPQVGVGVYVVSLSLLAFSVVFGLLTLPRTPVEVKRDVAVGGLPIAGVVKEFLGAVRDRELRVLACLACVSTVGLTAYFQLWQFVFDEYEVPDSSNALFFVYSQLITVVTAAISPRVRFRIAHWFSAIGILLVGAVAAIVGGCLPQIGLILVAPIVVWLIIQQVEFRIQTTVSTQIISSFMSAINALSSLVSFVVIGISAACVNIFPSGCVFAVCIGTMCVLLVYPVLKLSVGNREALYR